MNSKNIIHLNILCENNIQLLQISEDIYKKILKTIPKHFPKTKREGRRLRREDRLRKEMNRKILKIYKEKNKIY